MVWTNTAHDECVAALCRNKTIDIKRPDQKERSPLFVAARAGTKYANCVRALMSRSDLSINAKHLMAKQHYILHVKKDIHRLPCY